FRSFTFDGQTIPIQDHLEKRPEDRPRIEALVRADRLLIGPWHVLADLLVVSGESIIRNLQEGLRVSGEIGRAARVAYVADPFGRPAQIPPSLRRLANGDALLFMVGDDHVEAYPRLPEAVRAMHRALPNVETRIASLEEYAAAMPAGRNVVTGEIVRGRYRPILRGVNSARVWIKQEN